MDTNRPPVSYRTPQRGRSAYPAHLARAAESPRVPLHRRGTSQKFECFEDLLREAGFKETRVFTPEAERAEAAAEARRRQSEKVKGGSRSGVDRNSGFGLLGFLTGLVSRSDDEESLRKVDGRHAQAQSLGKAAGKQKQIFLNDDEEMPKSSDGGSDPLVTPTPNRRRPFTPIILGPDFSSPESSSSASSRSPPQLPFRSSHPTSDAYTSKQLDRTRLDARTTLRHMISLPEFALTPQPSRKTFQRRATEKPHTTEPHRTVRTRQYEGGSRVEAEREALPPLPKNWLSNVTRAVMGESGTGARVGRPQQSLQNRQQASSHLARDSTRPLLDTRNSFEYARREGSLARRGFAPRSPRVDTTPGIVTAASVVCRSAPGSRSSSLVRKPSTDVRARYHRQGRTGESCMPCLGITSIQLPEFAGLAIESDSSDAYSNEEPVRHSMEGAEDTYDEDDSSDEGELDFARLILPARRQHSIQSLRRHLHNHAVACAVSGGGKVPPSAFQRVPRRTDSQINIGPRNKLPSQADALNDPDDFLNSRRISLDEDAEDGLLADWAAQGLPGLQNAVRKKRGALPWTSRMQGS